MLNNFFPSNSYELKLGNILDHSIEHLIAKFWNHSLNRN